MCIYTHLLRFVVKVFKMIKKAFVFVLLLENKQMSAKFIFVLQSFSGAHFPSTHNILKSQVCFSLNMFPPPELCFLPEANWRK